MADNRTSLPCPDCGAHIHPNSMTRHWRRYHQGSTEAADRDSLDLDDVEPDDPPAPSGGLVSVQLTSPSPSSERSREPSGSSSVLVSRRSTYASAAAGVLDQHRRFSEQRLLQFLADSYPEIPEEHRFPLLIGAVTGVQTAAQTHMFAEYNRNATHPDRRRAADNALAALTDWNFGLRVGTRSAMPIFHQVASVIDPYEPSEPAKRLLALPPVTTSIQRYQLPELHLPVDYNRSNRDFAAEVQAMEVEGGPRVDTPPPRPPTLSPVISTMAATGGSRTPAVTTSSQRESYRTSTPVLTYTPTPIAHLRTQQATSSSPRLLTTVSVSVRPSHTVAPSTAVTATPAGQRSPRLSASERYRRATMQRTAAHLQERRQAR